MARNQSPPRRLFLQSAAYGLAGLSLPRFLQAREEQRPAPLAKADHCIVLFLNGGPSHLDMWDMKPTAAAEIRGPFAPISTSLPGYSLSEHLPRMAMHMHRSTVVRSMHHTVNNAHAAAVYCALTGHDRGELGGGTKPTDNPSPGSVLAQIRPAQTPIVPFVHLPYITKEGAGGPPQPGFFGGWMGGGADPLFITRDPNAPDFAVRELMLPEDVPLSRLHGRQELMDAVNMRAAEGTSSRNAGAMSQMSGFQHRAMDLLTSSNTQKALDVSSEPDAVRDRYGRNIYGQSVLLARRLIEAGCRLITVSWAPDANATWDTHGDNFGKLKGTLLPQLDAAYSSLIDDLSVRGMLDRTIVAVMGDFGRSPKINAASGRDHWNWCYSLMLTGGGFQQGLIHGGSDAVGAYPDSSPLVPGDIIATMYHALGINHTTVLKDNLGRPHPIVPVGEPVSSLLN